MNPRVLPLVALCAAVAACGYFFLVRENAADIAPPPPASAATGASADQRARGAAQTVGDAEKKPDATKKPAVNWKRLTSLMDFSFEQIPEPTAEDIARFLAKHGETAANLVVAFQKTKDHRLLDRALELFPKSPMVLMAAVDSIPSGAAPKPGETYVPDAQRMAYIERFKAADPNSPLPWIFSAQELFKSGQTGDAVADIRAALERPAFYTYGNEGTDAAQQLYEDLGLHPVEAGVFATSSLFVLHATPAMQASRSLTEWQKTAADSGDTAAVSEAIELTYRLGRTFATPEGSRSLIGELVGFSMESRALKSLPADAQPGWLAIPPAQRLAEIEKQKGDVTGLTAGIDWLFQSQNEQLLSAYLRKLRNEGERSALTWLKAQKK